MFIDDIRNPPSNDWVVIRSSNDGISHIKKYGMPTFISFDHDLGGNDTTMVFLNRLINEVWFNDEICLDNLIPNYIIHSANPVGAANIDGFMKSWKRSTQI